MTSFNAVWQGFIIMIVTIAIGVMMSLAGGTILDTLVDGFTIAGVYDVPAEWDQSGTINLVINLYYFLMYAIPVMGVAIFLVLFRMLAYSPRVQRAAAANRPPAH